MDSSGTLVFAKKKFKQIYPEIQKGPE